MVNAMRSGANEMKDYRSYQDTNYMSHKVGEGEGEGSVPKASRSLN